MAEYQHVDASDLSLKTIETLFYRQIRALSIQAVKRIKVPAASVREIDELLACM